MDEASGKTSSFGDKLKSGLATAGKLAAAGIAATTAAVTALAKASVEGYSEYEQLTGGVETLFKTSADVVMAYANNAYKTAGLSANAYMETVTSFSASLLQSLDNDTAAAAEYADMAITDMADNANKMGTSIEMIQNAYQGFAKQNFTMLDNLKLGYGGTKEEMQRLLEKAEELQAAQGVYVEYSIDSFADIVDAIHIVQTEIGITGTTATEASSTIQGSISAMKAAWTNLVVGIADENQELEGLINNFVDSVGTAAENLVPRVEQILSGIGQLVAKLAPIIAEEVPKLVSSVLPNFLQAGIDLLDGLIEGITTALPSLVDSTIPVVVSFVDGIIQQLPKIIQAGAEILVTLANGIAKALPELIPSVANVIVEIVTTLTSPESLGNMIDAAISLIVALAEGLVKAIPELLAAIPEIISNLVAAVVENAPKLLGAAAELMVAFVGGLVGAIPDIAGAIPGIITSIVDGFAKGISSFVEIGKNVVQGVWEGIVGMASWIKEKVTGFFSNIVSGVKDLLGIHSPSQIFADMGKNMALGLGEGWEDEFSGIKSQIESGMHFETGTVDVSARSSYSGNAGGALGLGGDTYNFYSPKALDAVTAAREMKRAKQQMALGYI